MEFEDCLILDSGIGSSPYSRIGRPSSGLRRPPPAGHGHHTGESRGGTGTVKSGRLTGNLLTRPTEPLQLKTVWGIKTVS